MGCGAFVLETISTCFSGDKLKKSLYFSRIISNCSFVIPKRFNNSNSAVLSVILIFFEAELVLEDAFVFCVPWNVIFDT